MKKEKKELTPEQKEKRIFIARVIGWVIFSCLLPVAFIVWRYDLFRKAGTVQMSGWGLFAIVIIFVFIYVLVKYINAGFKGYSMTKQVLNGVTKVLIPLGALLALCVSIRNNADFFIQALGLVLICETIAIPVNPFPKWVYEKTEGQTDNVVDVITQDVETKIKKKKKEEKK